MRKNIKNIIGFSFIILLIISAFTFLYQKPYLIKNLFSKIEKTDSMGAAVIFTDPDPTVLAVAYSANNCQSEKGYSPQKLISGNNSVGFPVNKREGLSSIKILNNFPNNAKLTIPGSNLSYTSSNKNQCINLGGFNDKGSSIEINTANKCSVAIYGGYNSDGSFGKAVESIINEFKKTNPSADITYSIKDFNKANNVSSTDNLTNLYKTKIKSQKILLVAHSISAIGVYNYKSSIGWGINNYLLYDPPYEADKYVLGMPPPPPFAWIIPNVSDIKKARENSIASDPNVKIWTCGYNLGDIKSYANCSYRFSKDTITSPTKEDMQKDHERFKMSPSALSDISSWLKTNCL